MILTHLVLFSFFGGAGGEVTESPVEQTNSGGWFPNVRHKTKEEIRQERIELGIIQPERKTLRLRKPVALPVDVPAIEPSQIDLAIAIQKQVLHIKRMQREDEELLLLF